MHRGARGAISIVQNETRIVPGSNMAVAGLWLLHGKLEIKNDMGKDLSFIAQRKI